MGGAGLWASEYITSGQNFLSWLKAHNIQTTPYCSVLISLPASFINPHTVPSSHSAVLSPSLLPLQKDKVLRCCLRISLKCWASDSHLLKTRVGLVNSPTELVTHEEPKLSNQSHDEHDGSEDRYEEDLEV